jgi:protein TonB
MVHAHVRPALQQGQLLERPSPARITAISGVIALHAAAFVLLMMPMAAPEPPAVREETTIYPDLPKRDPIRPKPVEKPKDPVKPHTRTVTRDVAPTPPQPPVVDAVGPDVAPPIGPVVDETPVEAVIDTGPVNLERLEYASAPPPPYPPEAARRRIEGTVVLRVLVDVDGKPIEVVVHTSSGTRALDESARKFVLAKWRFRPAMQGGMAVQAYGMVPIRFTVR